ncbi:unnamed protein product [Penicillium camemberti]|uniref:Str. FM013 n=1 Tax=Penicillium camemberti (strain FM 013) TaxID=1429867 RepID=A0A0G4PIY3_PENC3|nr:unnamed protein product [Penicillium camemberti]
MNNVRFLLHVTLKIMEAERSRVPTTISMDLYTDMRYDSDGNWVEPPNNIKLSNENTYLAIKHLTGKDRGAKYPAGIDGNGHLGAT